MKSWMSFVLFIVASVAYADGEIWLPNIPGYQTGTQIGGKNGSDVNIIGGTITFPSTLPVVVVSPIPLPVTVTGPSPLPVSGNVTIVGPSPLPVAGNVTIVGPSPLPVAGNVVVTNEPTVVISPTTLPVSIQSVAAGASPLPVAGNVAVTNEPTVVISPTTLPVSIQSVAAGASPLPIAGNVNATIVGPSPLPIAGNVTIIGPSPLPVSGIVSTNSPVHANGSTSVVTVTASEGSSAAPANAVCVTFESESGNSVNMRWGVSNSATAILSSSVGQLLEPGRSIDPCFPIGTGSYLHYIGVSAGSQPLDITWVLSQ